MTDSTDDFSAALAWPDNGLLPVVVQDKESGRVLMQAWVNRDALRKAVAEGRGVYFSRSRQALWVKGETSGNTQELLEVQVDCDGDSLLYLVRQKGPACHLGKRSCFFRKLDGSGNWRELSAREQDA